MHSCHVIPRGEDMCPNQPTGVMLFRIPRPPYEGKTLFGYRCDEHAVDGNHHSLSSGRAVSFWTWESRDAD